MKNTLFGTGLNLVLVGGVTLIVALVFVSIPTFASANTYAYVDVSGEVRSVTADNWQAAIATAPQIHMHSGVLLMDSRTDFTNSDSDLSTPPFVSAETYAYTYAYVDVYGKVRTVTANDWQTAIASASQIHPHSGVLRVNSQSDLDVVGNILRSIGGY